MGKTKVEIEWIGDPIWLLTFGDLITLLMTFFVLLISFSSLNTEKSETAIKGIQGQIGVMDKRSDMGFSEGSSGENIRIPEDLSSLLESGQSSKASLDYMHGLYNEVSEYLERTNMNQHVDMYLKDKELVMRIEADKIFKRDRAEFKKKNMWMLDSLFAVIDGVPNDLIISASAEKSFIPSSKYQDEFELSIARSINLCKYFIEHGRIKPNRIGVSEHGKFYPASSASDMIDEKWDYIEIILLSSYDSSG